jgi:hypothetical protein
VSGRRFSPSYGPEVCTTFKVRYTNDGINWVWADNNTIFNGPKTSMEIVTVKFDKKFEAIAVRLHCITWRG